jgi:Resolvase, N terminal domain
MREWRSMANDKCVAYYRVSTQRQGRSGLGLGAQRDAVQTLVTHNGGRLLQEITEVESGKRNDRPELRRAICRAKVMSRNASFLVHLPRAAFGSSPSTCRTPTKPWSASWR